MAGGLPRPVTSKIPVSRVAVETYELVWKHGRRIGYWAIAPFVFTTLIWLGESALGSSDLVKGSYSLEAACFLGSLILTTLVTVPYQVVIHRLSYPGFDFDQASHGPSLNVINKFYFFYSLIVINAPTIVLYITYNILYNLDIKQIFML